MPANAKRGSGPRVKKDGAKADTYRIGGVDLPGDPELDLDKPKPMPLFPAFPIPKPKSLTEKELAQVACHRKLRERIRRGPLYTVLGEQARVGKGGRAVKAVNPFEQERYSDRWRRERRVVPKLDTRPYVLEFFPKELWSTIDPTATETNGVISSDAKGKSLRRWNGNGLERDLGGEEDEGADVDVKEERGEGDEEDEDGGPEEEEMDDEFDDEDDGDDYNAEQYFDDGGDDAGEDYDAGGGDEGGSYE